MSVSIDMLHMFQDELARLRILRREHVSGRKNIHGELEESLSDVLAEVDRQILDVTLAIIKLGGTVDS